MTVYLAGPIQGMTDLECKVWRQEARVPLERRGCVVIDPLDRDYRGREDEHAEEIVDGDKDAIEQCDLLLVNACQPSWGTAMEVIYTKSIGKDVVAFTDCEAISPWLRCHTTAIYRTLNDAILGITSRSMKGLR